MEDDRERVQLATAVRLGRRRAIRVPGEGIHAWALAGAFMVACSAAPDEYDVPPFEWEGEHIRFATDYDEGDYCAGSLAYLDAYVGKLATLIGEEAADTVDYYWLRDPPGDYGPPCDTTACAIDNRVYTQWLPHEHELVHAMRSDGAARFFEEGVAVYWGDDLDVLNPLQGDVHSAIAESSEKVDADSYALAGHFVASLAERFDTATVFELYDETAQHDSAPEIGDGFARVFGESLDEAIDEYESTYPSCEHLVFRSAFFECGAAPMTVCDGEDATTEFDVDVSCANPEALGPRQGTVWLNIAIEIPLPGQYYIEGIQGEGGRRRGFMRLKRCAGMCEGVVFENETQWPSDEFVGGIFSKNLDAGRYVLQVHQPAEHMGEVHVVVHCPDA